LHVGLCTVLAYYPLLPLNFNIKEDKENKEDKEEGGEKVEEEAQELDEDFDQGEDNKNEDDAGLVNPDIY